MKTIFKYNLELLDRQIVKIPKGFEIISTDVQNNKIYIWCIVDTEIKEDEDVSFAIIGTGNPFWCNGYKFIGTVFTHQKKLVWHVFFKKES